jgi:DUF1680 family protein
MNRRAVRGAESLPAGAVELQGILGERFSRNVDYLLWRYRDADILLEPFENRAGWARRYDWDGEYITKWLDAAVLTAAATGDPELRAACDDVAIRLRATQEPDGYLGNELAEHRLKPNFPHWIHWLTMKGLREYGEKFDDAESLAAVVRAGEWVLNTFHPIVDESSPFFLGEGTPMSGFEETKMGVLSILDELAEVHALTGDRRYLDFGLAALATYPFTRRMRETGKVERLHVYSVLSYLGGAVRIGAAADDQATIDWVERVWEDIAETQLFPTASLSTDEAFVTPVDIPDAKLQETCATVEWMMLNERLYAVTGDVRYPAMIERVARNALSAAQSDDGMKWMYYTPLRTWKVWFFMPVMCCYFSGPRGIARLPRLAAHRVGAELRIDLIERGSIRFDTEDGPVRFALRTAYPVSGDLEIEVDAPAAMTFALAIRIPEHTDLVDVVVAGESQPAVVDGGYLRLSRTWSPGDIVRVSLRPEVRLERMADGTAALVRGVEVLALDRRDNDVDLSSVSLVEPSELADAVLLADGRPLYRGTVEIDGVTQRAHFTPYAVAGNSSPGVMAMDVGYRTVFPIAAGRDSQI